MATEIRTWEIVNGRPRSIESNLSEHGRYETDDLEVWIAADPSIIRSGLRIIGRQVMTRSGPADLLAIDSSGDIYVIELKRGQLPREALAQAIDYASDIQSWPVERISEICTEYTKQSLEEIFNEAFPDTDLENITVNESQRILLVGFALEPSLERMIEWLSDQYGVGINALVMKYVHTSNGSELLATTAILSEETEEVRVRKKKFTIATSDEPGHYSADELRTRLTAYLRQSGVTAVRMRELLFPFALERNVVTREELKQELVSRHMVDDPEKAGMSLTGISNQLGLQKNDFLRQVMSYEYPRYHWAKDNFRIRPEYRQLVTNVLASLNGNDVISKTEPNQPT